MTVTRRRFISVVAGTASASCLPFAARADQPQARWSGTAMGAKASLIIAGMPQKDATEIIAAVVAEIARLEKLFSLYRPDSALCQLNRDGLLDNPPADVLRLLGQCDTVHRLTGGRFDPTIQAVWALMAETAGKPSDAGLKAAYDRTGWRHVDFTPQRISLARKGMALTLNGIAQGYATDRVADLLRGHGVANVLVDMGEIAALGERAPGQAWRVGLAEFSSSDAEEHIWLNNKAVATSAPFGTVFDAAGRVGHILPPSPAAQLRAIRRVSVIHKSAALADGLSTGLCLMAPSEIAHLSTTYPQARIITAS